MDQVSAGLRQCEKRVQTFAEKQELQADRSLMGLPLGLEPAGLVSVVAGIVLV